MGTRCNDVGSSTQCCDCLEAWEAVGVGSGGSGKEVQEEVDIWMSMASSC